MMLQPRLLLVLALMLLVAGCAWKVVPTDPNDGDQAPSFSKGGGS